MLLSIIVPCYNEEQALSYFYDEYIKLKKLEFIKDGAPTKVDFELILVNDGSRDKTLEVIKELANKDSSVKYVSFSRNFGKEAAIYAGLEASRGELVTLMDADLQDPPSLLPQMFDLVVNQGYDSIGTRRVTRKGEPPIRSFFARMFYRFINKISDIEFVDGARDYRLMTRQMVDAILECKEVNRFSKGLFSFVGFRQEWIEYENVERVAGETSWSFWSLFKYAIEGIVAFSTTPLLIAIVVGCIISLCSFGFGTYAIIDTLINGAQTPGWASTITLISFLIGITILFLGIIGLYLSKIYLEIKNRPIYITKDTNIKSEK